MNSTQEPVSSTDLSEIDRILTPWGVSGRQIRSHRAPQPQWSHKPIKTLSVLALMITTTLGSAARPGAEWPRLPDTLADAPGDSAEALGAVNSLERTTMAEDDRIVDPPATRHERAVRAQVAAQRFPARWVAPLVNYTTTSCYGYRWGTLHKGVDLAAPNGTPIRSVGAGTVIQAGWDIGGYGYSVAVRHADGWVTLYAHASRILVSVGQRITAGTRIALVGSTGDSTGPHLHMGVGRGGTVYDALNTLCDPVPWMATHGVIIRGCG